MTSPDTKNLSNFLQEQENVSQTIIGQTEVDGTSLADVLLLSLQQNNKNFQSQVVRLIESIVRMSSGVTLAAGISFINPKQVHTVWVERPVHTTTKSTRLTTSSLKSSSSPLNSLGVSHACHKNLSINKIPVTNMYSSDFNISRAPAYQSRMITRSEDPFSKPCSAIMPRQPSSHICHDKSPQKKGQPPIFSKSPIFLENDFTLILFGWKKRRPLVKLKKRRLGIRGLQSKPLQHHAQFSLSKYVNRKKSMPLRARLLKRPIKRSVRAFSRNNNEKESFDLGVVIRSGTNTVLVLSSKVIVDIQKLLPSIVVVNSYYQTYVAPIIKIGLDSAAKIENVVNILKALRELSKTFENSTTKGKQKMFTILEFHRKQEKILEQIKDDPSLEYAIRKACLQDVNRVEDVVRPELATNRTLVRFNVLQRVWDCEKMQLIIAAYHRKKTHHLFNTIVATRYLSLWTPDFPLHVSSARFRQRVLERAAEFTGEVEEEVRLITDSEESFSDSLAKNKFNFTKLSFFSHALPILDTEIKKKEEIFPSHNFQLWEINEREIISTSFEAARKRYEQTTGSSVLDNHLQECIDDFLKGDIL